MLEVYLRTIPQELIDGVKSGLYEVVGSIVRDSKTKKIKGHLEPILNKAESSDALLEMIKTVTNTQNSKIINTLNQVQSTLGNLQSLAWVGTGVGIVNLGVSIVGFKMVSEKLNKISNQLYNMESYIVNIDSNIADMKADIKMILGKLSQKDIVDIIKEGNKNFFSIKSLTDILKDYKELDLRSEMEITEKLNACGLYLKEIIGKYKSNSLIGVGLDLIVLIYASYVNLIKLYSSHYFYNHEKVFELDERLPLFKEIYSEIYSRPMLDSVYRDYVLNSGKILLEDDVRNIVDIFAYTISEPTKILTSQNEIFNVIAFENFKKINSEHEQFQLESTNSRLLFVEYRDVA